MPKSRKPKAVKVRRPMPPPSRAIPSEREKRIERDILRQLRRMDWEDGTDPLPPHMLK